MIFLCQKKIFLVITYVKLAALQNNLQIFVVIAVTLVLHTLLTQTDISSKSNWIASTAEESIFLQKCSALSAYHNFTVGWWENEKNI